jgi:hypothetical protein
MYLVNVYNTYLMFSISVHKTLRILFEKIKIPELTIVIAFISSFNLWFLTLYFFKFELIQTHGLLIALLVTFGLTISWCLISGIVVPKYIIWFFLVTTPESVNDFNNENNRGTINLFVFVEIILLHSFFLYIQYMLRLSFGLYLSIQFWVAVIQYLVMDFSVKFAYEKFLKTSK